MKFVQPVRDRDKLEELKDYVMYKKGKRDWFLLVLGLNCGLRISDMLNLKVKDVKDYKIMIKESKTKKSTRIPLYSIKDEIDDYIKFLDDDDYLFRNKRGLNKPIGRIQAYNILKECSEAVGIKDFGCHSMRKSFGYHFYKKNKDISILMHVFNHSSESITKKYLGLVDDEVEDRLKGFKL